MTGEELIKCDICNENKTRKEFYITTKDNSDVESNECDECISLSHDNKIEKNYVLSNNEFEPKNDNELNNDEFDEFENEKIHIIDLSNESKKDRKIREQKREQKHITQLKEDKELILTLNEVLKKFKDFKLQMTAIPSENSKNTLQKMLSKKDWNNIRNQVIKQYNYRCAICNKELTDFNCHEMWEFDDINSIQILKQCIPLCNLCHSGIHPESTSKNMNEIYNIIINFCKINNCTTETYHEYKEYITKLSILRTTTRWYTDNIWKMNYGKYESLVNNKIGNVNEQLINKKKNSIWGGNFVSFERIIDVDNKVTNYKIDKNGIKTSINNEFKEESKNKQKTIGEYKL